MDETSTGRQYRFVLQGPTLAETEWHALLSTVTEEAPIGGYLVASGSLPPGQPRTCTHEWLVSRMKTMPAASWMLRERPCVRR